MHHALLILVVLALSPSPQDADTKDRFARALPKLGADDYQEREAATEELAALPPEALVLVEAELKKDLEAEVRSRLDRVRGRLQAKARRAGAERKKEALHAWNSRTAVDAYDKIGRKDARWDGKVRAALPLLLQVWEGTAPKEQARAVYDLLSEAVAAGCDDPLVLYGRARMYDVAVRKSISEAATLHLEAARAMRDRGALYHPMRRTFAYARAAHFASGPKKEMTEDERKLAREWLDLAVAHLDQAALDPETPASLLREAGDAIIATEMKLSGDRKIGFDKVFEVLSKARPESTLPLLLKGSVYTSYAWDARGSGWSNTVTPDGWKKMADRLAEAEQALTEAWKKNPEDPEAPTQMITVELGQGKGRQVMETWFRRAMAADPNNYLACSHKMYYLEPKWYGSEEAMLAFGRELVAAGNWEARLPFQLIDAHWTLAGYGDRREEHYKDPAVWKDIQSVYEPYLRKVPASAWDRSYYAKYACYAGRWAEAKAQFDRLGDSVLVAAFGDKAELDRLRGEAAEKGK